MKRLTIGVDIDGVIVDYASTMLPLLSEACHRPISYQDLSNWDLGTALNLHAENVACIWEQLFRGDLLRQAPPIDGALVGLSALSKHEIWLVTARPGFTANLTLSWLVERKVNYDRLVFRKHGDKLSAGTRFDLFLEDYLEEARAIAEAGVFSLLLDHPWNQAPELPENCQRVPDWNAIIRLINKLEAA